eukprot:1159122-Pelagomonas_calceolata.AAC.1
MKTWRFALVISDLIKRLDGGGYKVYVGVESSARKVGCSAFNCKPNRSEQGCKFLQGLRYFHLQTFLKYEMGYNGVYNGGLQPETLADGS